MPDKYRYGFTPLAVSDIDEALSYITDKLANAKAAGDLLDKIESTLGQRMRLSLCFSGLYGIPDLRSRDKAYAGGELRTRIRDSR